MKRLLLFLLAFYRRVLSPMKRPTCRFLPSCSEYAALAIEQYGPWRGSWKSLGRLLRCHPFGGSGYDPP